MEQAGDQRQVRRRRVFYIPGYDPIHPRRYRELYRKEGAAQAAISGYALSLSPKGTPGPYGWHVSAEIEGARVETEVEVLVWSDIVRDSMANTLAATYRQMLRTAWAYIGSGALWRLMRLRKGPVIAALYPVGALVALALAAFCVVAGVVWACVALFGAWGWSPGVPVGLGLAYAFMSWVKARDGKTFIFYLMHDYGYSAQSGGENPSELEARMFEFGKAIAAALQSETDEVLVVGHSSGAHLGISVLADLIRAGQVPGDGPALGLLTLGQVVPMVSFLPKAARLRADLAFLAAREEIAWVDVTAPGDGCAFALCDPVSVSGVAPEGKRWPLVISAAFTQTLSPERWRALRWRFFRLHFQYLCAFDRPGDYDYFRITAGPQTLAARFAGRAPSKSRIEVAVSKYTSVAA
ncbi:hypothetical protein ACFO5X_17805 [Seohaeicola nanhaiensis]|uniref:Alpha/beta hydrolase n=1 Tax=Seohaeicola nanhaiensis TaxID=1387282 RepID=A0ABV9KKC0_9RHOB